MDGVLVRVSSAANVKVMAIVLKVFDAAGMQTIQMYPKFAYLNLIAIRIQIPSARTGFNVHRQVCAG